MYKRQEEEDRELERELLADEKELAEHNMLVDLGRNDIGRIARFGTVEVDVYKRQDGYGRDRHERGRGPVPVGDGYDYAAGLQLAGVQG